MREFKRENLYAAVLMLYNYWLLKDWYRSAGISSQGYERGEYFPEWPLPLENPWLLTRFENRGWLYLVIMGFLVGSVWQLGRHRPGLLLGLQGLLIVVYLHDLRFQSPFITLALVWGVLLFLFLIKGTPTGPLTQLGLTALLGASDLPLHFTLPLIILSSFGRRGEVLVACGLLGAYYDDFGLYLVALISYVGWEEKPRPAAALAVGLICLGLWGPWQRQNEATLKLKVDERIQTITLKTGDRPRSEGDVLLSRRIFRGMHPDQLQRARTRQALQTSLRRLYPEAAVEVNP